MSRVELPPLPPPYRHGGTYESAPFDYFSADHMRVFGEACARAALEAAAHEAMEEASRCAEQISAYDGPRPGDLWPYLQRSANAVGSDIAKAIRALSVGSGGSGS